jgi:hypothetical protein
MQSGSLTQRNPALIVLFTWLDEAPRVRGVPRLGGDSDKIMLK